MKKTLTMILVALASCLAGQAAETTVTVVDTIPTTASNNYYVSNQAPLQAQSLIKLPNGSIIPGGWLMRQLELQRDGLNGHLGEISAWLQKDDNAWLKSGGKWGWEEVPYWLRGYASLSYIMKDATGNEDMFKEAKYWIDAILDSQREDGNFGPAYKGKQDFWPNMIALWILQDYYEYTGDSRVIPFMTKYAHYQLSVKDEDFLSSYWENSRGGDNLWSVVWLYNRTKDPELLKLGEKIHKNTANWTRSTELPNWHNVNIAQCFREPATWYLFNGDEKMRRASYNVQSLVRRAYGQVPGGMYGSDENCRIGFFDPRQGTETCGFAEQMSSDEIMLQITGDSYWAENCEDVAFNSYPAAFMPDYKSLRYITCPNHVLSDSENHSPGIQNGGPFLAMNPFSSRCCQHNHGFAWPYYAEHLVYATPDNGLAAVLYSSSMTKARVGDGTQVILEQTTNYPFEESVEFNVRTLKTVDFPLYLRIPSWTKSASVYVNGKLVKSKLDGKGYVCIARKWNNGDKVKLNLPMEITYRTWQVNKNSVSVNYGPLTLSLKIAERYEKKDSKETAISDSKWQPNADPSAWPSYEIYPDSDWNYALVMDAPIKVQKSEWPSDNNPFTLSTVPLSFTAKGRKVPSWTLDEYKLCAVLPYEDDPRSEEVENITLVPMGAARLRISAFPTAEK
ncbi:MAG: glycoside hydrolase family 127 protein [Verrucomicrobia bacterium]|nr:glycoside hydrolase family 127 protein [Verrucomicrobiota bacterium]